MSTKKRDAETGEVQNEAATLRLLMRQCADELDEALALKVGVMDSESKAAAVNSQRMGAMQSVATRLREA
jgi:stage III sporulation protein SpoIIIAA